jgi:hypothetical protein
MYIYIYICIYIKIFSHVSTQLEMIRSKIEIFLDMVAKLETRNEEFENLKRG